MVSYKMPVYNIRHLCFPPKMWHGGNSNPHAFSVKEIFLKGKSRTPKSSTLSTTPRRQVTTVDVLLVCIYVHVEFVTEAADDNDCPGGVYRQ